MYEKLIREGRMEGVRVHGRDVFHRGEVVVGNKLGRTIGFPTSKI